MFYSHSRWIHCATLLSCIGSCECCKFNECRLFETGCIWYLLESCVWMILVPFAYFMSIIRARIAPVDTAKLSDLNCD